MPKSKGNPAKSGWQPLTIGPAADRGDDFGMAGAFYRSNGRLHWYRYRHRVRAVQCLAFHNRLYNGFCLVFEDTTMHLTFKRNDRAAVRDWRHFQAIKNEVAGPEREALEIFPPESQLVDAANEYHLWVLPEGAVAPVGFHHDAPQLIDAVDNLDYAAYRHSNGPGGSRQRGWEPGIPTGLGKASDETLDR